MDACRDNRSKEYVRVYNEKYINIHLAFLILKY